MSCSFEGEYKELKAGSRLLHSVQGVNCAPCTTPATRGRRTRYSHGDPATPLAAVCCSVSPWQRDGTLGFLDNSDYSTSQAAFHTCQSEIRKREVSNN